MRKVLRYCNSYLIGNILEANKFYQFRIEFSTSEDFKFYTFFLVCPTLENKVDKLFFPLYFFVGCNLAKATLLSGSNRGAARGGICRNPAFGAQAGGNFHHSVSH